MRAQTQDTIRRAIERHLTQACTIRRESAYTEDAYGTPSTTPIEWISACYVTRDRRQPPEAGVAGGDVGRVYYTLQLPWQANPDLDVKDGDTVIVDGVEYQVSQANIRHSNAVMQHARITKAGA